jgi:hypothetical protein
MWIHFAYATAPSSTLGMSRFLEKVAVNAMTGKNHFDQLPLSRRSVVERCTYVVSAYATAPSSTLGISRFLHVAEAESSLNDSDTKPHSVHVALSGYSVELLRTTQSPRIRN